MPMPKNFTPEQIIAHLAAQTSPNAQGVYQGQAAQLNQFVQYLDQQISQLDPNSPQADAMEEMRARGSQFLMDLSSFSIALEAGNAPRMNELMQRMLRRYQQFQTQFENFKVQFPDAAAQEAFASFEQDFGGAVFSEGGELLDQLNMSDKK